MNSISYTAVTSYITPHDKEEQQALQISKLSKRMKTALQKCFLNESTEWDAEGCFENFLYTKKRLLSIYAVNSPSSWLDFSRRMRKHFKTNVKIVELLKTLSLIIKKHDQSRNSSIFSSLPSKLKEQYAINYTLGLSKLKGTIFGPWKDQSHRNFIKSCKSIAYIFGDDFDKIPKIHEIPIPYLVEWVSIRELTINDIYYETDLSDEDIQQLLPDLKYVILRKSHDYRDALMKLKNVEHLSFDKRELKINDEAFEILKTYEKLLSLDISSNSLNKKNFNTIKDLTQLTTLNIGYTGITNKKFKIFQDMSQLTSLNIHMNSVMTGKAFETLANFKQLTHLDISSCDWVTDKEMTSLKDFIQLTSLNLANCKKISDEGLKPLSALTNLTSLDLMNCENISDGGMHNLHRVLPNSPILELKISSRGLR